MATQKFARSVMGPQVSEGTRLLWASFLASEQTQVAYAASVGTTGAYLGQLLYGDRRAGRRLALRLMNEKGIAMATWDLPPKRRIALPAAARATAA